MAVNYRASLKTARLTAVRDDIDSGAGAATEGEDALAASVALSVAASPGVSGGPRKWASGGAKYRRIATNEDLRLYLIDAGLLTESAPVNLDAISADNLSPVVHQIGNMIADFGHRAHDFKELAMARDAHHRLVQLSDQLRRRETLMRFKADLQDEEEVLLLAA